jgi:hypothetical protein
VIWRAKGDFERAIADTTEAIRLAKARAPVNVMTPPASVLISAYTQRGFAHEAKGDDERAKQDYTATLEGQASDAGSKANQATARIRLSLLQEAAAPAQRTAPTAAPAAAPIAAAPPAPPAVPIGKRVALVIGNGAYTHVRALPNPPNDAHAIAKSCAISALAFPKASTSTARRCRRRSAISCARRRARRSRSSTTPAMACRSTAAIFSCLSISRFRRAAA